jgi:hypothetical protein
MASPNAFVRFVNFLANLGLIFRQDPPRQIRTEGREWGETVEGLQLSIQENRKEDPDQLASISVIMKNVGNESRPLTIPGWMHFFRVETTAPLSAFGQRLLAPDARRETINIVMNPGDATETDVPAGSLYDMSAKGEYPVRVSCTLPGGATLLSNAIRIRS